MLLAALLCGATWAQEVESSLSLPPLGPWLLDETGAPAHWLGHPFQGRTLFEPINVVLVDAFAESSDQALDKVLQATTASGFGERWGHSSGYWATLGTDLFPQISSHDNTAVSDGQAVFENNHGRLFGPLNDGGRWIFVGALSRESFHAFAPLHHQFVSFNRARDEFALRLSQGDLYRISGLWPLDNRLDDPANTTADHDGQAVVLEALR